MTQLDPIESPAGADGLISALQRMLRPLVRLLVQKQVQYPLLSRILKGLYVDVAASDFPIEGRRLTVSRLSLLTGIHRREVKRIQDEGPPGRIPVPSAVTLGAQIVARWTGEAPWRSADGSPRPLPRSAEDPDTPSFHSLVASVSLDIHPRSVLDEWLRLGVARIDEQDHVVLSANAFVPVHGFEEKAHYVGRNVGDHLAAASHNLISEAPPFLERSVYYGSLPREAVEELSELATKVGQEALERVNDRARALKQEALERGTAPPQPHRFSFGVYLFEAPSEDDSNHDENENETEGADDA